MAWSSSSTWSLGESFNTKSNSLNYLEWSQSLKKRTLGHVAVNVCRLARKTNRKSRKEQQTEELDAPRLPMWSLNPFAHSLHETSPHFSVTGSRGILVCWLNQNRIPLQIHFPCILPIWRCLSSTKGCMTSPFDLRQASPVWQVLSAASLSRQVNLQPLADFIISRYPAARVPIWNIIETGSPRFVPSDVRPYRGGGDGRIRQEIVFHSKCINTAFCK